jgi:hypothetical protein
VPVGGWSPDQALSSYGCQLTYKADHMGVRSQVLTVRMALYAVRRSAARLSLIAAPRVRAAIICSAHRH